MEIQNTIDQTHTPGRNNVIPIVECQVCGNQYKPEGYSSGAKVRCRCGHLLVVPQSEPQEAAVLHCADCGGPVRSDALQCDYCGGFLDQDQSKKTLLCPNCFARLSQKSKYCVSCAHPIRPQPLLMGKEVDHDCPRCKVHLHTRKLDDITVEECPSCSGLWLSSDAFREISKRKVEEFEKNPLPQNNSEARKLDPVVYLKCPECGVLMNRKNFGRRSGVIVDKCHEHGIWLDDEELERIAKFIADGGLQEARKWESEEAARQAEQARNLARNTSTYSVASGFDTGPTFSHRGGLLGSLLSVFFD